jgi:hypothetical protein
MAIVVHMHANIDHHRPYGAKEARIFLEQLFPEAPDVVVQIAHLAGGGGKPSLWPEPAGFFKSTVSAFPVRSSRGIMEPADFRYLLRL